MLRLKLYRGPCTPVTPNETQWVKDHLEEITKFMQDNDGIGLAAPQLARPYRWAISGITGVLFNPTYEGIGKSYKAVEGCLSLPGLAHTVKRYERIRARWTDLSGIRRDRILGGYEAQVFQHEADHVNDKLIGE